MIHSNYIEYVKSGMGPKIWSRHTIQCIKNSEKSAWFWTIFSSNEEFLWIRVNLIYATHVCIEQEHSIPSFNETISETQLKRAFMLLSNTYIQQMRIKLLQSCFMGPKWLQRALVNRHLINGKHKCTYILLSLLLRYAWRHCVILASFIQ